MYPYKKKKSAPPPRSKGNFILFKLFFWVLGTIAFVALMLVGIAAFYEEGIGNLVIGELKKSLKTKLEVESAELSLVWDFPRASVSLKNVRLRDTGSDTSKYLLTAEKIALKCGIFGLLTGSYKFTGIEIKNASIYVHNDRKGLSNYDVFISTGKDAPEPETPSKLDLSIENAIFTNVALHYENEKSKQDFKVLVTSAFFAGDFTDERFDMTSYANIKSERLKVDKDVFMRNKEFGYNAVIHIDHTTNTYSFENIEVTLESNRFKADGKVVQLPEKAGTQMEMKFSTDKARLNSLLKILPKSYLKALGDFDSQANMKFDAKIDGIYSDKSLPKIDVHFGLKDGRLTHPKMASDLKNVSFDLVFNHSGKEASRKEAKLELQNFKALLGGNPIEVKLLMEGIDNPKIDFSANGVLTLKTIFGLLGDQVTKGQGEVQIDQLHLKGNYNDMLDTRKISAVEMGGVIQFKDAGLVVNEVPMVIEEGVLSLKNNIFNINNITFRTPKSDIILNGNFQNVLPVLFSDSLNSQHAVMNFKASLHSEKLDIDELLKAFSNPAADPSKEERPAVRDSMVQAKNEQREFVTNFFNGTFIANIKEIKYDKIVAKHFNGELSFEHSILKIKGLKVDAMGGSFELNSKYHFEKEPYMITFIESKNIDIQQFFIQLNNFGQETITEKNLRGKLNSVIKINAFWDSKGNFLDKELVVLADIHLQNGELIDLDILNRFSKFIKLDDLHHIRFTDLRNQFKIQNGVFHMPAMFIQSNALNITIAGKHSFNQDIDYKLKINAGQVIANRLKSHNSDLEPLPAKQKGLFNIYCRIWGNLDGKYDFKMGKKNVKKYLDAELDQELNTVSNTLKAEFEKSDLFTGSTGSNQASKVSSLKEPEDWKDNRSGGKDDDIEYIDGF